jgi:hypothetical protein
MDYKFSGDKRLKEAAQDPYVYPEYQPDPHRKTLEGILDCLKDIHAVLVRLESPADRQAGRAIEIGRAPLGVPHKLPQEAN